MITPEHPHDDHNGHALPVGITEQEEPLITEVVTFSACGRLWCISTRYVSEARSRFQITTIPGTEKKLYGVIDYRGSILPVFDMAKSVGMSDQSQEHNGVIVFGETTPEFGVLISGVPTFNRISMNSIRVNRTKTIPNKNWILGIMDDETVCIDGHLLLNDRSFSIDL